MNFWALDTIHNTAYYTSHCINQTWMQAARSTSVHSSNWTLRYTLDCTRLHTPCPLDCTVLVALYRTLLACLTYTLKHALRMLLSTLPSILPSMLSSTLPSILSRMLAIALEGTLQACITACLQMSTQSTSNYWPSILQSSPPSIFSHIHSGTL